jgi:tetratricopeptide (TPR) repeat protein
MPRHWPKADSAKPARYKISNIPFIAQDSHQCGPAALAMVFQYHGFYAQMEKLTQEVFTPSLRGSLQPALISAARRHGFIAYPIYGAENLLKEVSNAFPVIILQNLGLSWLPAWHYAVVIGYDIEAKFVLLHSGLEAEKKMPVGVFDKTWARSRYWGLVVLPPTQIPATAAEVSYIECLMGLEKAKQWGPAITGYKRALKKWPSSLYARIGLGNSYYALGDLVSASTVLKEAITLSPHSAAAYNNLAQVLSDQGKMEEALAAAKMAVEIGGSAKNVYQKTYNEIKSKLQQRIRPEQNKKTDREAIVNDVCIAI